MAPIFECLKHQDLVLTLLWKKFGRRADGFYRRFWKRNRMQGTWLILHHYLEISNDRLASSPIFIIASQLADGGPPSGPSFRCHWLLCVGKVLGAHSETHIAPPPQLNEIMQRVDWAATVTPRGSKRERLGLLQLLM